MGSVDAPFNPVSLAIGVEASFVARSIDSDRAHLSSVLRAAAAHEGTALVEIYQNCNIFNDGAFEGVKDPATREELVIRLEHGVPIRWGAQRQHGLVRGADGALTVADVDTVGEDALLVHDEHAADPAVAFALSRLSDPESLDRTPIGVFRSVLRPTYDALMAEQLERAAAAAGPGVSSSDAPGGDDALDALLAGRDAWSVP